MKARIIVSSVSFFILLIICLCLGYIYPAFFSKKVDGHVIIIAFFAGNIGAVTTYSYMVKFFLKLVFPDDDKKDEQ